MNHAIRRLTNIYISLGGRVFRYFPWFFLADLVIWGGILGGVAALFVWWR